MSKWFLVAGGDGYDSKIALSVEEMERLALHMHGETPQTETGANLLEHIREPDNWACEIWSKGWGEGDARGHLRVEYEADWFQIWRITT